MNPPDRLNACWDSLAVRVRPTSTRLSPARKTHPKTLAVVAVVVPGLCYLLAYAGLGFAPSPLSVDVLAATLILSAVLGFPIFASVFLRGVFITTVTVYPSEGVACRSWGPYHLRLWRKWVPVGDGPWRIVPATFQAESAALHDAMGGLMSCSPTGMMRGMQKLSSTDEDLGAVDFAVWGLTGLDPESDRARPAVWFRHFDDAHIALLAIVQAGGTAAPADPEVFGPADAL